ncbi:MAG: FtsX-like permease family protein, partial [Imperialibacter sp.]
MRLRKNPGTDLLSHDEIQFYEDRLFFADSTLFNVFDFELKRGDPARVMREKHSMVISEALATKYFDKEDPIGKTLRYNNLVDLKITGIMAGVPRNSHFIADAFITFSSLDDLLGEKRLTHWGQFDHYTYVLLKKGASPQQVESKLPDLLKDNAPEWVAEKETLFLQPLTSIHLHSDRKDEITPSSSETYSYMLGTIAIFILLMACANFINLSTATQISRSKEIAIQKILGASRIHLVIYFWVESIVICFAALAAAYILGYVALPYFNMTTGKQLTLESGWWLLTPSILLTMAIGFLSSIIPSLQAMRSNLLQISKLNGSLIGKSAFRSVLITFQFSISIFLIISTLIVSSQFNFMQSIRLGFESDQVIVIPVKDRSQNSRHSVLISEISQLSGVEKASFSSSTPGTNNSLTYTYSFPATGIADRSMATFLVDENFIDLYDI